MTIINEPTKNVLTQVFYFLPNREIEKCQLVSKLWQEAANSNELWNALIESDFQMEVPRGTASSKRFYSVLAPRLRALPKDLLDAMGGFENYLKLPDGDNPPVTTLSKKETFSKETGDLSELKFIIPVRKEEDEESTTYISVYFQELPPPENFYPHMSIQTSDYQTGTGTPAVSKAPGNLLPQSDLDMVQAIYDGLKSGVFESSRWRNHGPKYIQIY